MNIHYATLETCSSATGTVVVIDVWRAFTTAAFAFAEGARDGWKRDREHRAGNIDLWEQLLGLCEQHDVEFRWVRGHTGNPDNERCDQLATEAARGQDLLIDTAYETGKTQEGTLPLFSL